MSNNYNTKYNTQTFTNNVDIDKFFRNFGANGFAEWFNSNISKTTPWKRDYLGNNTNYTIIKNQWEVIWSNLAILYGRNSINLVEFICLNAIMINETGGSFIPKSELIGNSSNPGLSYAFNAVGGKSSYNTNSVNKNCYTLFNDNDYITAHGSKGMSAILKNTKDIRWQGKVFPNGFAQNQGFSRTDETSVSGVRNGFLIESDFFKFRGRGFIQTTGRSNYKDLVNFVINYNGNDPAINSVKVRWQPYGSNIDKILTISTTKEWDDLFQKTNNTVANYAVYSHAKSGNNYSTIDSSQSSVGLESSIRKMGAKIAGGRPSGPYPTIFYQRVMTQLDLINNSNLAPIPGPYVPTIITPVVQEESRYDKTGQDPNSQVGSDKNITGSISSLTNIFKPTAVPESISFDLK